MKYTIRDDKGNTVFSVECTDPIKSEEFFGGNKKENLSDLRKDLMNKLDSISKVHSLSIYKIDGKTKYKKVIVEFDNNYSFNKMKNEIENYFRNTEYTVSEIKTVEYINKEDSNTTKKAISFDLY